MRIALVVSAEIAPQGLSEAAGRVPASRELEELARQINDGLAQMPGLLLPLADKSGGGLLVPFSVPLRVDAAVSLSPLATDWQTAVPPVVAAVGRAWGADIEGFVVIPLPTDPNKHLGSVAVSTTGRKLEQTEIIPFQARLLLAIAKAFQQTIGQVSKAAADLINLLLETAKQQPDVGKPDANPP